MRIFINVDIEEEEFLALMEQGILNLDRIIINDRWPEALSKDKEWLEIQSEKVTQKRESKELRDREKEYKSLYFKKYYGEK